MKRRPSRLGGPSPALVVAVVALFVALGGTAAALKGRNTVDSGDIKNGQVTGKDVRERSLELPQGTGRLNVQRSDLATGTEYITLATIPAIGPVQARCDAAGEAELRFVNASGLTIHSYLSKGEPDPEYEAIAAGAASAGEAATPTDLWTWRLASEGEGVPWAISTQVLAIHEAPGGCTVHLNWHSFPARPGAGP